MQGLMSAFGGKADITRMRCYNSALAACPSRTIIRMMVRVEERVVPVAEARTLCMSMGADLRGVACSWQSNNVCYIVLPSDEYAPVATFRRHEIAHCNGWSANHPRDG
jgi:hypothetical protein